MRLLVCGSRDWPSRVRIWSEIDLISEDQIEIVHGAAQGADLMAHAWAVANHVATIPFPANWSRDGKAAGPIRNARMLADGKPDRGLAFGTLWKQDSRDAHMPGAWKRTETGDMVIRMLRARLPVRWVATPDAAAVDLTEMPEPPR